MKQALKDNIFSVPIEEIRKHPEIILSLLEKHKGVSLSVDNSHTDNVNVVARKVYAERVTNLVQRAKAESKKRKESGVDREQAVKDYKIADKEIRKYL